MGLAYKYAQKFCPKHIPIEDSDTFADALIGLVQAERDYDPTRLNAKTGKPLAFSTCAYKYMWTACIQGHRNRCRQDRLEPWQADDEWQFGLSEDEPTDNYAANAVAEQLKSMKLEGFLKKDLEMLLTYYLGEMTLKQEMILEQVNKLQEPPISNSLEMTLEQVGKLQDPPICKERVRQRINRVKQYIVSTVHYETLEEIANVSRYRDGIQRWWEDDFNQELLSKTSAA